VVLEPACERLVVGGLADEAPGPSVSVATQTSWSMASEAASSTDGSLMKPSRRYSATLCALSKPSATPTSVISPPFALRHCVLSPPTNVGPNIEQLHDKFRSVR